MNLVIHQNNQENRTSLVSCRKKKKEMVERLSSRALRFRRSVIDQSTRSNKTSKRCAFLGRERCAPRSLLYFRDAEGQQIVQCYIFHDDVCRLCRASFMISGMGGVGGRPLNDGLVLASFRSP